MCGVWWHLLLWSGVGCLLLILGPKVKPSYAEYVYTGSPEVN